MVRKLLTALPVLLVFEILLYLVQAQQIKKLDRKAEVLSLARRQVVVPTHTFGELLAYQSEIQPEVLAVATEAAPVPQKRSYVVAAIGDSMVETMGDSLDYLKAALREI